MRPPARPPTLPPPPPPTPPFTQLLANLARERDLRADPEAALHGAMQATNVQLHRSPVDDSLSGTTACVGLLHGATLLVANVGDSRAVLGERGAGAALLARDLSSDQTPFRWVGGWVDGRAGGGAGGWGGATAACASAARLSAQWHALPHPPK